MTVTVSMSSQVSQSQTAPSLSAAEIGPHDLVRLLRKTVRLVRHRTEAGSDSADWTVTSPQRRPDRCPSVDDSGQSCTDRVKVRR